MFLTITMLLYCIADVVIAIWLTLTCNAGWTWMVIANAIMAGFWLCPLLAQRPTKAPKRASGTTGSAKCAKETPGKPNPDAVPRDCIKVIPGTGRIDVHASLGAVEDACSNSNSNT